MHEHDANPRTKGLVGFHGIQMSKVRAKAKDGTLASIVSPTLWEPGVP